MSIRATVRCLAQVLLTTAAMYVGIVQAACLTSEVEPNNYGTNANTGVCSGVAISGSVGSLRDYDWYRLDVTGPGTISISLSQASNVDFDWYLYASTDS